MCHKRPLPILMVAALWACFAASVETSSGQGFKEWSQSLEIELVRRIPPKLTLDGTRICVQADTTASGIGRLSGASGALAKSLKTTLESALLESDTRLTNNCVEPQTAISCTIILLEVKSSWQTGKSSDKGGIIGIFDKSVNKEKKFLHFNGSITVSFQAHDTRSGETVDSGNFSDHFEHDYENGIDAPTDMQVAETLMGGAVRQIAGRMVPVVENITVWLARGKLDKISKDYGKTQAWPQMLELLETMTPFPKSEDDAYRHYNIGLAYEALAYQAEDLLVADGHLQKASIHYSRALQMKPSEKYFVGPQKRIEEALVLNKGLIERQRALAAAEGKAGAVGSKKLELESRSSASASSQSDGGALTNSDVIKLQTSGMDSKSLIDYINSNSKVSFDTTHDGLSSLLKNGVPNEVVNAILKRQKREGQ